MGRLIGFGGVFFSFYIKLILKCEIVRDQCYNKNISTAFLGCSAAVGPLINARCGSKTLSNFLRCLSDMNLILIGMKDIALSVRRPWSWEWSTHHLLVSSSSSNVRVPDSWAVGCNRSPLCVLWGGVGQVQQSISEPFSDVLEVVHCWVDTACQAGWIQAFLLHITEPSNALRDKMWNPVFLVLTNFRFLVTFTCQRTVPLRSLRILTWLMSSTSSHLGTSYRWVLFPKSSLALGLWMQWEWL